MDHYKVFNIEGNKEIYEYNITVQINKNGHEEYTLSRSLDDSWSENVRGQELIKIIDTGDMMIFPKKMFAGDVGYDVFAELFILMSFINKTELSTFCFQLSPKSSIFICPNKLLKNNKKMSSRLVFIYL